MADVAKRLARRVMPHRFYRAYRRRKVLGQIASYPAREVSHSYGGYELRLRIADPLAEGWYDHDWPELAEIAFLREQGALKPGARVFDLGAHQGVVALMLSRVVGAEGLVVAVEGEPHNAAVAKANRELNSAANIEVIHGVVAESCGVRSFAEGLNGAVDERATRGTVEVPAVTVDGLAEDYGAPDLVFIDIEGYEGRALQGAAQTLAAGATTFFVEVHEELVGFDPAGLIDFFEGWRVFVSPVGADGSCDLREYRGQIPAGRFFLAATPPSGIRLPV